MMSTRFVHKFFNGVFVMLFLVFGAFSEQVTSAAAAPASAESYVPAATAACGFTTETFTNSRGKVVTRRIYTCNGVPVPITRFRDLPRRFRIAPLRMYRQYGFVTPYGVPYVVPYNYSAPVYNSPTPSYTAPTTYSQPVFSGANATAGTTMNVFTSGNPPVVLCSVVVAQDGQWSCRSDLAYPTATSVLAYAAVQPSQAALPQGSYCAKQSTGTYSCVEYQPQ
jgi:hypothetical protein